MTNPTDFRAWLKRRRLERGLTQEELGELVGYAAQTITKIEGGKRRPSPQLARRLSEVLELAHEEHAAWMAAALAGAEPEAAAPETTTHRPLPPRPPTPLPGLPTYLTPFVGREREQAEIQTLLTRPDCRLITLLGPGGVGKTRLAIETARRLEAFSDRIAFASLASVLEPESIVSAIGDALGVTFVGAGDLRAQLVAHLRDRRALLVLDNLEHLLDATGAIASLLEQLLTQTSGVFVLATSRERLRLAGEWVLELAGLALPQPRTPKQPTFAPALMLFAGHAERVDRAYRSWRPRRRCAGSRFAHHNRHDSGLPSSAGESATGSSRRFQFGRIDRCGPRSRRDQPGDRPDLPGLRCFSRPAIARTVPGYARRR
ncbi:MAG: helix-turn-helix domain-containing protein [Blastochloris sp.]|nr:helix-turn-helix domain-containing protein [Blastochloris sp.]